MERRENYVLARVGGAVYKVDVPMTNQTLDALKMAQSGREAKATEQIKPLTPVQRR